MQVFNKAPLKNPLMLNVFNYPLKIFYYSGMHPRSQATPFKILFYFNFLYFAFIFCLAVVGVMVSYDHDLNFTVESLQTCILIIHSLGKYGMLYWKKSTIVRLLESRNEFWKIDQFPEPIQTECRTILQRETNFVRFYLCLGFAVSSLFYIQPFITGDLPSLCYEPEGWHLFLIFSWWYLCYFMYACITTLDAFFSTVCIPVIVQFKLLAYKFQNVKFTARNCRELVDYHNFLLTYCSDINKMASGVFLLQFVISIAASCMQLFIATQEVFALGNKIKCFVYFIGQIMQTAIYCFCAELITNASGEISTAVYASRWYESDYHQQIKKDISLVMVKSQRQVEFSGYGLVFINLTTFTTIFKTAMSFYTYLNTME